MYKLKIIFLTYALLTSMSVISQESSVELGYVKLSGNSDTETLNAKFDASKTYEFWKHSLHLETTSSSSNDVRSAEKYMIKGQSNYDISNASYALGSVSWEKDKFNGFEYQAAFTIGLGCKAIQVANMELNFELAPGYRVEANKSSKDEDVIIRTAENFSWKITKTSTLTQTLSREIGDSNTTTRFGAYLTGEVSSHIDMKLGYNIRHNSNVPTGYAKTDRETSVTLVYEF